MRNIQCILTGERIELSEYHTKLIKQAVKDNNGPIRAEIHTLTPESSKQRRYLHGGLIPLLAYLDNQDHKDHDVLDRYFEYLKREFNLVLMKVNGKLVEFGGSTKGSKALNSFIEKCQDFIHEQYGIDYNHKCLQPANYVEWRDTIASSSTEDYIDYCVRCGWINKDKEI